MYGTVRIVKRLEPQQKIIGSREYLHIRARSKGPLKNTKGTYEGNGSSVQALRGWGAVRGGEPRRRETKSNISASRPLVVSSAYRNPGFITKNLHGST
jgi:hypothetical protein